ncbi:MAG: peroxide stress protein YaaA [Candidatus Poribacteria bacterium]|nr:peroxide stress protein YaaA [Candidatus Poribacteria bacterium]
MKMNYLLIISCSQRKVETDGLLPAIDRYDGPTYRCLRKFRDANSDKKYPFPTNLRILILSAKFGLIHPETEIPAYDLRMTTERAEEIRHEVKLDLYHCLHFYKIAYGGMDQVFINLGKTYMRTLDDFHWGTIATMEASGGIGLKTQQMKAWLERIFHLQEK